MHFFGSDLAAPPQSRGAIARFACQNTLFSTRLTTMSAEDDSKEFVDEAAEKVEEEDEDVRSRLDTAFRASLVMV